MTGNKAEESKQGDTSTVPGSSDDNTANGVNVADVAEARALKTSRIVVLFILAVVAGGTGFFSFTTKRDEERESFEVQAEIFAFEIEDRTRQTFQHIFQAMSTMGSLVSSYAKNTNTTDWPMETFPAYESIASDFRDLSGATTILMAPLVELAKKDEWEEYAVTNQGWIQDAMTKSGILDAYPQEISEVIYEYQAGQVIPSKVGPFAPVWQLSAFANGEDTSMINFNLMSNHVFEITYNPAIFAQQAMLSKVFDEGESLLPSSNERPFQPESIIVQPLYNAPEAKDRLVVGALVGVISWDLFLSQLLHEGVEGMVCVLSNTCGQAYTYEVNGGNAVYVGMGDRHDSTYDHFSHVVGVNTPFDSADTCAFSIHVYPSKDLEEDYNTFRPALFATMMVLVFLFSAVLFHAYDKAVARRQKDAVNAAARTDAIVSSLFPAEIRDRLFDNDEPDSKKNAQLMKNMPDHQKLRLKNYLTEEELPSKGGKARERGADGGDTKPIADLFPNTTVMFADISGFTAWSSVREPSQVFTLLETVYKAFDINAKRHRVFKVETVGDCYVAVTGLPEPLEDHAVAMCLFARECVIQFNELSSQLEVLLGPDTGDLAIRVGLHSGPVTAGVLRGEKSRFQLFGDTVNTAARIETTGLRNKIHLSHETAEKLHAAGKSNWIVKRKETVVAKGKGEIQTYWLLSDEEVASGTSGESGKAGAPLVPAVKAMQPRLASNAVNILDPESTLPPRIKRLVDWNVDVLKRLLKQIVAKRNTLNIETYDISHPLMMRTEVDIGCDTFVLDEVSEIIKLPKFDARAKQQENPNKIDLPKQVEDQLRLYVASIAAMHRDNHFHNFEHASHVMMSVSKLLSRIVAPDEIMNQDESADAKKLASSLHDHTYGITSDPLTQFAVVLSALIHDVDHSGVSNFQLIKENAKIATAFRNKSVAEQNSIILAWERLMESRFSVLRGYIYADPSDLKRFRQLMVNTVLATDIFDKELQSLRKNRWDKAFREEGAITDSSAEDDVNRKATIVIEHLIQASDVAHTMQHWHIYQKWNERLFMEMMVAHDNDRMEKNPSLGWYRGELGFFDNYVIPLAKKLKDCGVFGVSSDEYLNYALENRREWSTKGEEVVEKMIAKFTAMKEEEAAKKEEEEKKLEAS